MANRITSDGTRTVERWTNEGTPGYYSGNPLTKQRDLTAAEAAELAAIDATNAQMSNRATIEQQADQALAVLRNDSASRATYLAIASPTNAQVAAQVRALTQQMDRQGLALIRLIRLIRGQLDGTD